MIDNIEKFKSFLFTHYPKVYEEVRWNIWCSPSSIYKDTFNVFNPFTNDKKKAAEFENIIEEYGYTPLIRLSI